MTKSIGDLPHALDRKSDLEKRLSGKRPAMFLDFCYAVKKQLSRR